MYIEFPVLFSRSLLVISNVCVLVAQLCLTLCNSMDCSPPGSSYSWSSPGRNTVVGCHSLLQGGLPNPGIESRSPALQADSWLSEPPGIRSDQISCSVVSDSLRPHESQHTRPPCPSPTPRVHSDSRPSSQWCHPAISSFVVPFSSCPQSLPASESFPTSQLFAWGGQSTGVSALASVLPMNTQDWSPLGWSKLIVTYFLSSGLGVVWWDHSYFLLRW